MPDRQVITRKDGRPTPFQLGNKLAVGQRKNPLTQVLISQLHEIDPATGKEKQHEIIAALIKCATGYIHKSKVRQGNKRVVVETSYPPDLLAIREILNRVDGVPKQTFESKTENRTEVIYQSADEIRKEFAARGLILNGEPLELTINENASPVRSSDQRG